MKKNQNFLLLHSPLNQIKVWQTCTETNNDSLYGTFNLGLHVNDSPESVHRNRMSLLTSMQTQYPCIQRINWLNQVHGDRVVDIDSSELNSQATSADAQITSDNTIALAIMTADCVPIMLSSPNGEVIGAIHAGWQGLAKGIIVKTIEAMQQKVKDEKDEGNNLNQWQAWVGACIAQEHYEVDARVKNQVLTQLASQMTKQGLVLTDTQQTQFFTPQQDKEGHYLANLPLIAMFQLQQCGIVSDNIFKSGLDSYGDKRFFSYRRQTDQGLPATGRMATLIFMAKH